MYAQAQASLDAIRQMMVLSGMNLDNGTDDQGIVPSQEENEMAKRIRREIMINGTNHWISAYTEQEFADKLLTASGAHNSAPAANISKHEFCAYAHQWFEVFSRPNIEQATANTYRHVINKHLSAAFAGKYIEDLTPADVQQMFNAMDCAQATKQKVKTVLNMIFQQALDDGLIQRNPLTSRSIRIKGSASQATEPYSVAQMQYLVQNIHRIRKPQDRAFMALQTLHPLRLEEALGLQWQDIDLARNVLHIRRAVTHPSRNQPVIKDTKTASSHRTLDLVPQIAQHLQPGKQEEFVIGGSKPLSYTQVRRMCERIQKDIGFDETLLPRRFRTTVLTDLYDTTKDVKQTQLAAGHSTPTMTMRYYVKGRSENANTAAPIAGIYGLN